MATQHVKKVTGYQAPDGSTHATSKLAIEHTQNMALKKQIAAFVASLKNDDVGINLDDRGHPTLDIRSFGESPSGLETFLFAHRESIQNAFKTDIQVRLRSPRKPKPAAVLPIAGIEEVVQ